MWFVFAIFPVNAWIMGHHLTDKYGLVTALLLSVINPGGCRPPLFRRVRQPRGTQHALLRLIPRSDDFQNLAAGTGRPDI
jgi:hypothetical protein